MRAYVNQVTAATDAGSTLLPDGLRITKIVNDDATNFATISFDAAIGTDDNPEGVIAAGGDIDFRTTVGGVQAPEGYLYHQADTAAVKLTIIGYIK